jgi:cytochrome c556
MFARVIVLTALGAAMCATNAQALEDQDVIDYRQHIMKALDAQTAALGMVVSTQVPNDNLVAHLEAIAVIAKTSLKSFEEKVQGGESQPAVWQDWADFSKRMNEFAEKTAQLAETGRTRGQDAVMVDMVSALSCKGCHDVYRKKK